MITVVNEPKAEYNVSEWDIESKILSLDDYICGIENEKVLFCPPSGSSAFIFNKKPKKKLSLLRGKMIKQTEKEIDDQISELRNEWNRNI